MRIKLAVEFLPLPLDYPESAASLPATLEGQMAADWMGRQPKLAQAQLLCEALRLQEPEPLLALWRQKTPAMPHTPAPYKPWEHAATEDDEDDGPGGPVLLRRSLPFRLNVLPYQATDDMDDSDEDSQDDLERAPWLQRGMDEESWRDETQEDET